MEIESQGQVEDKYRTVRLKITIRYSFSLVKYNDEDPRGFNSDIKQFRTSPRKKPKKYRSVGGKRKYEIHKNKVKIEK